MLLNNGEMIMPARSASVTDGELVEKAQRPRATDRGELRRSSPRKKHGSTNVGRPDPD